MILNDFYFIISQFRKQNNIISRYNAFKVKKTYFGCFLFLYQFYFSVANMSQNYQDIFPICKPVFHVHRNFFHALNKPVTLRLVQNSQASIFHYEFVPL